MQAEQEPSSSAPPARIGRLKPLAVLLVVMALVYASGLHHYLGIERLAANQETIENTVEQHFLLALCAYFLVYALVVALSLPVASLLTLFGGFLFGPLIGGTLTVIAATLGALIVFLIARTSLGDAMAAKAGPWLERLRAGFQDHALNYLLFLRLVPLFPFWLVNIAPALLGVGTSTYVLGTLIGIIPATYAFSYLGAGLGSIIEAQGEAQEACLAKAAADNVEPHCQISLDPSHLVTSELLLALVALGCAALIPVALKKLKKF